VFTTTVTAKNVHDVLVAGVVFTLTADLSRVSPMFNGRPVGAHFVSQGPSSSGWCVTFLNTYTGKTDAIMAEDWVLRHVRVLGHPVADPE